MQLRVTFPAYFLLLASYSCHPEDVILNLFQDLFQDHIGFMDSGSAAGMTDRGVAVSGRCSTSFCQTKQAPDLVDHRMLDTKP